MHKLNANNTVMVTYGTQDHIVDTNDTSSFALGLAHSMSKRTTVYAAYLDVSDDDENAGTWGYTATGAFSTTVGTDQSASGFTLGLKHTF